MATAITPSNGTLSARRDRRPRDRTRCITRGVPQSRTYDHTGSASGRRGDAGLDREIALSACAAAANGLHHIVASPGAWLSCVRRGDLAVCSRDVTRADKTGLVGCVYLERHRLPSDKPSG